MVGKSKICSYICEGDSLVKENCVMEMTLQKKVKLELQEIPGKYQKP